MVCLCVCVILADTGRISGVEDMRQSTSREAALFWCPLLHVQQLGGLRMKDRTPLARLQFRLELFVFFERFTLWKELCNLILFGENCCDQTGANVVWMSSHVCNCWWTTNGPFCVTVNFVVTRVCEWSFMAVTSPRIPFGLLICSGLVYQEDGKQYLWQVEVCMDTRFRYIDCNSSGGACSKKYEVTYPIIKHPYLLQAVWRSQWPWHAQTTVIICYKYCEIELSCEPIQLDEITSILSKVVHPFCLSKRSSVCHWKCSFDVTLSVLNVGMFNFVVWWQQVVLCEQVEETCFLRRFVCFSFPLPV